jgi:enoyl-CoA hydratase
VGPACVERFLALKLFKPKNVTQRMIFEQQESIATLTLDKPERHNALGPAELKEMSRHLSSLRESEDVRALIITGRGDRTFCSGAALDNLAAGDMTGDTFAAVTDALAALPIVTLCAFNGSAYGGGAEIGLACDFRIGKLDMKMFVPPARIGLCYPVNGIERFVSRLGVDVAKRLLLASEELDGTELYRVGYLTHLVDSDPLSVATELASRIQGYAPLAIRAMKQICDSSAAGNLDKSQAQQLMEHCNRSQDLKEGFRALKEKRAPVFQGR